MSGSISTMTKCVLISVLLCLIGMGAIFYTTKSECEVQVSRAQNIMNNMVDWENFTSDTGNTVFAAMELASLDVSVGSSPVYSSDSTSGTFVDKIFPTSAEVSFAGNTTVKFTVDTSGIQNGLIIEVVALIVLVFAATLITAQLYLIENYQDALLIKNSILSKRYEDLPFEDLSRELTRNDKKNEEEIAEAKRKIERLANAAALDPLTNLYNRQTFNNTLDNILSGKTISKTKTVLGIFRASEVQYINSERGYQMGDKYIQDLAGMISDSVKRIPGANAYRISGTDIAVLVPNGTQDVADNIVSNLKLQLTEFQKNFDLTNVCYSGFTIFEPKETKEDIMAKADLALAKAQTSVCNGYAFQAEPTENYFQGELHWLETVKNIISSRRINLFYQPIKGMNISIKPYVEIYTRFTTEAGENLSTETVLAAAQRHDLLVKLEEMIIESIIAKYRQINDENLRFGINLSSNALINTAFLLWLERALIRHADIAQGLVFEVDESMLESNYPAAERLFTIIRRSGSFTSISHFGRGLESFKLFRELNPSYIKIDPNICQSFEKDTNSQQFVRMIIELAHRQNCVTIAEGVESLAQRQRIEAQYIDAMQGYIIAKPEPLVDKIEFKWVTIQNAEYSA